MSCIQLTNINLLILFSNNGCLFRKIVTKRITLCVKYVTAVIIEHASGLTCTRDVPGTYLG